LERRPRGGLSLCRKAYLAALNNLTSKRVRGGAMEKRIHSTDVG